MPKKAVHIKGVDSDAWILFIQEVLRVEGRLRGNLGRHVSEAFKNYVSVLSMQQHAANGALNFANTDRGLRSVGRKRDKLVSYLKALAESENLKQISFKDFFEIIDKQLHCRDERTVKKYWLILFADGYFLHGPYGIAKLDETAFGLAPEIAGNQ